jgi:PhnB protein
MAEDPAEAALVMHSQLTTSDGFTIMGSDTPDRMPYSPPAGVTMSISGDEEAKLEGFWNALADGGQVTMPLDTPPWGGKFGMLVDRYGVPWMINVNAAPAA